MENNVQSTKSTQIDQYEELGKRWLRGEIVFEQFEGLKLNPKQIEFINEKSRFNLVSGGMAAGKTLAYIVKFILLMMMFPGTRALIGRKTKGNAVSTFMKDFADICPAGLYEYKIGEGKIIFVNGSEAVFFGLDALQSGDGEDLKKAVQDLRSHNFGFIFIDQLEEIEMKVFEALNSRMRRRQCKHSREMQIVHDNYEECKECGKYTFSQMNFTTNPANFWAYDFFKANPRPMTHLVEVNMLDNKEFLSEQFIQSELAKPKRYVQKFVYGEWSPDSMVEGGVFAEDYIRQQQFYVKAPLREFDGIKIFAEPEIKEYQVGLDPSEGVVDPCCIKVVCKDTGEEGASYTGFTNATNIVQKVVQLSMMYSMKSKPLIVPECVGAGQAVIELLKRQYENIYEREVFLYREQKNVKKLGFHTNFATKQQLIEKFIELLQKRFPKLRDAETLNEFKTFIYSDIADKKGAGAQRGYHDDRVIATMLAYWNIEAPTHKEKSLLDKLNQKKKKPIKYQYV